MQKGANESSYSFERRGSFILTKRLKSNLQSAFSLQKVENGKKITITHRNLVVLENL